ncbi:GNAT family N-acetyltransferase [Agromyces marinus]|uniref:N-acetyltransferase n=1 Tax=Agromyces marinus TaxID=1389020 RepID=A0ABM8GZ45_9MICO|nr:GNAT family N-acetyltransferase [Agromyces marinus]UIP58035.1 hypothetical protein DSM26151_09050 [Agromyces marinus]BDZ53748.1 N-acetyltransferase [Agromyces marinus]
MTQPRIIVRPAAPDDSEALLGWRNDPTTRAVSLDRGIVDRADHDRWYAAALASTSRHILIAVVREAGSELRVGMVRFDRSEDGSHEVSINLAPEARGKGMSGAILGAAIEALREEAGAVLLRATIRDENEPSIRLFAAAGFRLDESSDGVGRYSLALD